MIIILIVRKKIICTTKITVDILHDMYIVGKCLVFPESASIFQHDLAPQHVTCLRKIGKICFFKILKKSSFFTHLLYLHNQLTIVQISISNKNFT